MLMQFLETTHVGGLATIAQALGGFGDRGVEALGAVVR